MTKYEVKPALQITRLDRQVCASSRLLRAVLALHARANQREDSNHNRQPNVSRPVCPLCWLFCAFVMAHRLLISRERRTVCLAFAIARGCTGQGPGDKQPCSQAKQEFIVVLKDGGVGVALRVSEREHLDEGTPRVGCWASTFTCMRRKTINQSI